MKEFEVEFDEIYQELGEMTLELPEDPMYGGPAKINSDISKLSEYIDRVEVLQTETSKKLTNLKSSIKNRKTLLKILTNRKFKKIEEYKDDPVDVELDIFKLEEILDPIQNLVDVIDNKASYLKNKESRIRLQWRVMEKRIALGERPKPASFEDPTLKQMNYDEKETTEKIDSFLKEI